MSEDIQVYPALDRVDLTADLESSPVDHPPHYHHDSGVEVIDAVEAGGLGSVWVTW